MKKSSLGRRSSAAPPQRTLSEFETTRRDGFSGIPVRSRTSSADRTLLQTTSTLMRSKSQTNLKSDSGFSSVNDRRLTGTGGGTGTERLSRGSTSSRLSSYGGSRSKGETRPLQDKQWQMSALRDIEEALRTDPEGMQLCEDRIKPPFSIKRFLDITNVFISKLDDSIKLNSANYVNEIPFVAKLLGYRGKVDKSWLIAVNTPHAFAHVVGFLHFLASCFQTNELADPISLMYPENFCGTSQDSWRFKELLPYLHESYALFVGDCPNYEERQQEKDQEILQAYFGDEELLIDQINCLEADNRRYEELIRKKANENQSLEDEAMKMETEFDKLHHDFERQTEILSSLEDDIKHLETESTSIDSQEKLMTASLNEKKIVSSELQNKVNTQRVSQVHIKQIRESCVSLQRQVQSESKYVEEYENQLFTEDLALAGLQDKLNSEIREYTLKIDSLDIPSLEYAKLPSNIADLDAAKIDKAYACLKSVKSQNENAKKEAKEKLQNCQHSVDEYNVVIAKLQDEYDKAEEEINAIKEELNTLQMEHAKRSHELKTHLESIEEKRRELKKSMPPENLEELIRMEQIKADEMEAELQEYNRRSRLIIMNKMQMFEEHKARMPALFKEKGVNVSLMLKK